MSANDRIPVCVFLCECGPIIRDLVDLEQVAERMKAQPGVAAVHTYATLCSEEGRAWMRDRLTETPEARPVIGACSPREHADTFASVCEAAGVDPYLLGRANLREQVAWVTPDREQATAKAIDALGAAIARTREQEPLEATEVECLTDALVIGSGVAGMTAARLLADAGRHVVLVEREPAIGGKFVLFGEAFPEMECASCMLEPLMDTVLHHPDIDVMTSSEVEELLGYFGRFTARIRRRARGVDPDNCFACGTCREVCPVEAPGGPADAGMGERKAAQVPYPGALPNASAIDPTICLHTTGGECTACADNCPFGAIDLHQADEVVEREFGAVVVATGADLEMSQGEGSAFAFPGVVSTYAFERILNPDGPTAGEILRPDGTVPKSIALVHCADEAGHAPSGSCSRICCLVLAKAAHEIRAKLPEAKVIDVVFERTAAGRGYREFLDETAKTLDEVRLSMDDRVEVTGTPDGGAVVRVTREGATEEVAVDLAVVAPQLAGAAGISDLAGVLGVDVDAAGFIVEEHRRLRPFASRVEGVLVAGAAQGPKDMAETASHAAAAAAAVLSALVPGRLLVHEPITAEVDPDVCGGCRLCIMTCPYKAIAFDDETHVAVVNELLCHGCGTCVSTCPSSALTAHHFTDAQVLAEIGAYAGRIPDGDR